MLTERTVIVPIRVIAAIILGRDGFGRPKSRLERSDLHLYLQEGARRFIEHPGGSRSVIERGEIADEGAPDDWNEWTARRHRGHFEMTSMVMATEHLRDFDIGSFVSYEKAMRVLMPHAVHAADRMERDAAALRLALDADYPVMAKEAVFPSERPLAPSRSAPFPVGTVLLDPQQAIPGPAWHWTDADIERHAAAKGLTVVGCPADPAAEEAGAVLVEAKDGKRTIVSARDSSGMIGPNFMTIQQVKEHVRREREKHVASLAAQRDALDAQIGALSTA